LSQVFRQRDRGFIRLLDAIRTMSFDQDDLDAINERYLPEEAIEEPYLTLCSTNAAAQQINKERLEQLITPTYYYAGEVKGEFNPKLFPTEYKLELKVGGQVMLIRNDLERRFVNGSLAVITNLEEDKIIVSLQSGESGKEVIEVPKMTWEVNKYTLSEDAVNPIKSEVIGSFTQYPLRLAWAVTVHKSQGKTYERVAIDLGKGAFEHGQTYVALSRCTTIEGVFLKRRLTPRDIMVDERVAQFYDMMR
jgi:ATP-dependent exoDNAse (exonuclease V) alpha subunit